MLSSFSLKNTEFTVNQASDGLIEGSFFPFSVKSLEPIGFLLLGGYTHHSSLVYVSRICFQCRGSIILIGWLPSDVSVY